jgi:NADPH:quinone reductase-like Zn-dependent oxidoreductase
MSIYTMKAARIHAFGPPEVLVYEDAPMPLLGDGEVLVRVRAASVNPPDWYLRDGYSALPEEWRPQGEFPMILGSDISGEIVATSGYFPDFKVGDEVYAMVRFPEGMMGECKAYAQYVTVPVAQIAHKPKSVDHVHAAAAPMSLLTAWQFLVDLGHSEPNPLQPHAHTPVPLEGKRVLINGAAGGVGHYAVQVAKLQGAYVIAVASSRHQDLLKELGADEVVDYTKVRPEDQYDDLDLVFDCVGGPTADRFLKTIKRGGALFLAFPLGFDGAERAAELDVFVSAAQVRSHGAQLAQMAGYIDDGSIRSVVDSVFPLAETAKAHARAAQGHIQGKIVLTVD